MKPNPHSDPLDRKIDALLRSRPLQASDDFTARVLAAAETPAPAAAPSKRSLAKILAFALPMAAALAVTVSLLQIETAPIQSNETATLTTAEAQEIFLLEESLSGLPPLETNDLGSENLLSTLDALFMEI